MHERAVRVVPRQAITVAIEGPRRARSYGLVANISEGGACVLTDASLPLGEDLTLAMSFFREAQVVPVAGRVVWSSDTRSAGAVRYGFKWVPGPRDDRLSDLIRQAASL